MLLVAPVDAQIVKASELTAWPAPRIFFWVIIGTLVLGGALLTITRKNPVAAVMSLVATFFGTAAIYALLFAHFLAVIQVLVYAGAIMTLFVFVVMVLNREEVEAVAWRGILLKGVGAASLVLITVIFARVLSNVIPAKPEPPPGDFGTVEQVGTILFTDYLFAFEAVSVLLLVAVIAAVVVARVHKHEAPTPEIKPEVKGH
jgi:NADH-quinone oxidoreductase subunit J